MALALLPARPSAEDEAAELRATGAPEPITALD
jgi:hypothetical protein